MVSLDAAPGVCLSGCRICMHPLWVKPAGLCTYGDTVIYRRRSFVPVVLLLTAAFLQLLDLLHCSDQLANRLYPRCATRYIQTYKMYAAGLLYPKVCGLPQRVANEAGAMPMRTRSALGASFPIHRAASCSPAGTRQHLPWRASFTLMPAHVACHPDCFHIVFAQLAAHLHWPVWLSLRRWCSACLCDQSLGQHKQKNPARA